MGYTRAAFYDGLIKVSKRSLKILIERDRCRSFVFGREASVCEQILNQVAHANRALHNEVEILFCFLIQFSPVLAGKRTEQMPSSCGEVPAGHDSRRRQIAQERYSIQSENPAIACVMFHRS